MLNARVVPSIALEHMLLDQGRLNVAKSDWPAAQNRQQASMGESGIPSPSRIGRYKSSLESDKIEKMGI